MYLTMLDTPWGGSALGWTESGICDLFLTLAELPKENAVTKNREPFGAIKQLSSYFRKELTDFDLPLIIKGSAFQMKVWRGLLQIPYGQAWSYQKMAETIGHPCSARAVGNANHANRIPIIIPCHRVIQAGGAIGGYGGGPEIKKILLELEGFLPNSEQRSMTMEVD